MTATDRIEYAQAVSASTAESIEHDGPRLALMKLGLAATSLQRAAQAPAITYREYEMLGEAMASVMASAAEAMWQAETERDRAVEAAEREARELRRELEALRGEAAGRKSEGGAVRITERPLAG